MLDRELNTSKEDKDATIDQEFGMGDQEDDKISSFSSIQNENHAKMNYTIVSKDDVRQRLEDKITKVVTVLLLPRNEAAILLQHFKWNVNRTNEEWLACEEKIHKTVGLFAKPVVETPADATEIGCRICLANFPRELLFSVSCGHQICQSCWEGHISEAINDGPRCLTLRCPNPSCDAALGLYSIELLSSKDDKNKFENHFLRSYITNSRKDYYVKEFARKSLVRYNHYCKEWEICIRYRESALADLMLFQDMQLQVLCGIYSLSSKQLDFLVEALLQVVDCWQLLKWTYIYGYFLPNDEHIKKCLFEFMQKKAVVLVKQLHKHVEEELQNLPYEDVPFARILEFRNRKTKLTRVTRNYLDQLVKGLTKGLSEVVCVPKLSPRLQMSQERGQNNSYTACKA